MTMTTIYHYHCYHHWQLLQLVLLLSVTETIILQSTKNFCFSPNNPTTFKNHQFLCNVAGGIIVIDGNIVTGDNIDLGDNINNSDSIVASDNIIVNDIIVLFYSF